MQRSKNGTVRRTNHGLVRGTGRIQPNGALKRSDPTKEQHLPEKKPVAEPISEPARPRTRTVIDQSPIPLYCSDQCRLADLQCSYGSVGLDYNPDRHSSPTLTSAPHDATDEVSSQSDSGSSSTSGSATAASTSSICANLPPSPYPANPGPAGSNVKQNQAEAGRLASARAYAALASLYDLPPPPPPRLTRTDTASSSSSDEIPNDYQSGVMMAAKRIGEALIRQQPKKKSWATPQSKLSTQYALDTLSKHEVIPGWTDGSNAWRAHVYSFAPPPKDGVVNPKLSAEDDPSLAAYRGHISTPLRSQGVYSTVTDTSIGVTPSTTAVASTPVPQSKFVPTSPVSRAQSEVDMMYSKWNASLTRRCESRQSLNRGQRSTSPTGSTRSLPTTIGSSRSREVPLVAPGAEGKLLVPNVKMRRVSSSGSDAGFVRKKSPLSRQGSEMSVIEDEQEEEAAPVVASAVKGKKPAVEGKSASQCLRVCTSCSCSLCVLFSEIVVLFGHPHLPRPPFPSQGKAHRAKDRRRRGMRRRSRVRVLPREEATLPLR